MANKNNKFKFDVIILIKIILSFVIIKHLTQKNSMIFVESLRADLGTSLHITPSNDENNVRQQQEELYVLAFINYTFISTGKEVSYSEEKGRYGEGKIFEVQGYLEHVTSSNDILDHTACKSEIRGTNGNLLSINRPWIALIRRGRCTFEEKIKNAWKYGAIGIIVYNDIPTITLEKMKIIDKDRNITAIFTYKWIGEELGRIVDDGEQLWVSIVEGQRGIKPQHNINKTSVLFVSISFIVLMIISLVWLIFYYIQRFRYLQSKDQHSRHLCAVAKRVIMRIPTKSGKNEDKDSDNDCCAICIEPYKATDCIRVLPCKHEFHKNCIDPWLLEHRTCPMCKLDVLKHYGFVFLGSEESIIQLDLDMEIGNHGLNNSTIVSDNGDGTLSAATTQFHIQTFNDHSHLVNDNMAPTAAATIIHHNNLLHPMYGQRVFHDVPPERSQSSLSCINHMLLNENIVNKIFLTTPSSSSNQNRKDLKSKNINSAEGTSCGGCCDGGNGNGPKYLDPNDYKINKQSISLPGTLKKKRLSGTDSSCHGSNNCYVNSTAVLDLKQLASKIEKGCPKSRTSTLLRRQASDDEHLLNSTDDYTSEIIIDDDSITNDIPLFKLPPSFSHNTVADDNASNTVFTSTKEKSDITNITANGSLPSTEFKKNAPPKIQIEKNLVNNDDDNYDHDNNDENNRP